MKFKNVNVGFVFYDLSLFCFYRDCFMDGSVVVYWCLGCILYKDVIFKGVLFIL